MAEIIFEMRESAISDVKRNVTNQLKKSTHAKLQQSGSSVLRLRGKYSVEVGSLVVSKVRGGDRRSWDDVDDAVSVRNLESLFIQKTVILVWGGT